MIINSKIKNTSDAIDYLNRAVFGEDPETSVLTRVYESDTPIQDRVTAVENSAALVDVQALKDKVEELSELTEIFANFAAPMPNLVINGDLTLDSDSNGIPDGFIYVDTTNNTLVDGIAKFTPTAVNGRMISSNFSFTSGDLLYIFARIKTDSNLIKFRAANTSFEINTSGTNDFEFLSGIRAYTNTPQLRIQDYRTSGWTPIEIDYMGAYNVSTMKLKGIKNDDGIPFTLLTDGQIKTQLDLWVQTRFPLDVLLMMRS